VPESEESTNRDIAAQLEQSHPNWIVVFGVYTKQFVAFPRFRAPDRTILAALYPDALADRMKSTERLLRGS